MSYCVVISRKGACIYPSVQCEIYTLSFSGGDGDKDGSRDEVNEGSEKNENLESSGERGGNGDKPAKKIKNGKKGLCLIFFPNQRF